MSSRVLIIIITIFGSILFVATFIVGVSFSKSIDTDTQRRQAYTQPPASTSLRLPLETLKNPAFTHWSGSVKGKVTAKDTESFTISPISEEYLSTGAIRRTDVPGEKLKITVVVDFTHFFYDLGNEKAEVNEIQFNDVPVGAYIVGQVTLLGEGEKYKILGKNITVQE